MNTKQPESRSGTHPAFRGRLARRMLMVLVPAVLLLVVVTGFLLMREAREQNYQRVAEQLHQAERNMRSDIDEMLLAKSARLDVVTHRRHFVTASHRLLTSRHYDPAFASAQKAMIAELEDINRYETYPVFNNFLILDSDFAILASSNAAWTGLQTKGSPLAKTIAMALGTPQGGTIHRFTADSFGGVHFLLHDYSPLPSKKQRTFLFTVKAYQDALSGKTMYIVGISEEVMITRLLDDLARRYPGSRAFFLLYDGTYLTVDPTTGLVVARSAPPPYARSVEGFRAPEYQEYVSPMGGERVFAAARWVPTLNAAIGMELPLTVLASRTQELTPYTLGLLAIMTVLLSALVWGAATYVTRPVLQIAEVARRFAEGDWQMRSPVERDDEIGLLSYSFNRMAEQLSELYRSLETQVRERSEQIRTAAEVAALATSATDLREILRRSVDLIVERFPEYYHASVFLIDENGYAVLEESTGPVGEEMKRRGHRLKVGSNSIVGWAAAHRQPRIASDVMEETVHFKNPLLPETRSEAGIPLVVGNEVLGVLDVQSKSPDAFDEASIETLQALAAQLATAIYNARLRERAEAGWSEAEMLYGVVGELASAETEEQVVAVGIKAVTRLPRVGALFARRPDTDELVLQSAYHPQKGALSLALTTLGVKATDLRRYLPVGTPLLLNDLDKAVAVPEPLLEAARALGCQSGAFVPVYNGEVLAAVFFVGEEQPGTMNLGRVEAYLTLANVAGAALSRVRALDTARRRLQEFDMLVRLGQSIAAASTPQEFYVTMREQIVEAFGEVGVLVALYDPLRRMITVPYAYEDGKELTIEPFPLGKGLVSHVIVKRQPLLIAEDMEAHARALGAKIVGQPAKSWLGVPLMVGERLLGVLVLQDLHKERAFDEEDLEFAQATATSVALLLSKVQVMTQIQRAHQREQVLFGIVQQAQETDDVERVVSSALNRLAQALNARRGMVRLRLAELADEGERPSQGEGV